MMPILLHEALILNYAKLHVATIGSSYRPGVTERVWTLSFTL